jgi:hypothetical protein
MIPVTDHGQARRKMVGRRFECEVCHAWWSTGDDCCEHAEAIITGFLSLELRRRYSQRDATGRSPSSSAVIGPTTNRKGQGGEVNKKEAPLTADHGPAQRLVCCTKTGWQTNFSTD